MDATQEESEKIQRWRATLTEIGNISGLHVQDQHESQIVQDIVRDILPYMNEPLDVGEYLVGVDVRLRELKEMHSMRIQAEDVLMVGIWGPGGVGKSTIAKAIYNELSRQIRRKSFLHKVGDASKDHGLLALQKQLYSDISPKGQRKISNIEQGILVLKRILYHEKVLLVIDDVTNEEQLENLAGGRDWFGQGSIIIITCRDRSLIEQKVDKLYELGPLTGEEALELFSWHAFNKKCPSDGFYTLANQFVQYCQGLPLALRALGSSLNRQQPDYWERKLLELDQEPEMGNILNVLKVSLDGLDYRAKATFLDIACFFKGEHKDFIVKILDGCGFLAESRIELLRNRCLLTISNGKVDMHNLIQQLGHKIVSNEGPMKPGARSRLWQPKDVYNVVEYCTGTCSIEGIFLNLLNSKNIDLTTESMKDMKGLRLLKFFWGSEVVSGKEDYGMRVTSDFAFPVCGLHYLYWHGYPLNTLPSNFVAKKQAELVELNMPYSNIKIFGERNMVQFSKLTDIILSHSKSLIEVSNFSRIPNLEKLVLEGCTSLRKIDPSIGDLKWLGLLDLKECKSLRNLPDSICDLQSLKILHLSGCSELDCLPEDLGNMSHLTELHLDRTATGAPPSTICRSTELQILSLSGCKSRRANTSLFSQILSFIGYIGERANPSSLSLSGLSHLRELDLSECYWWDAEIPDDFWGLYSLEKLNLSGNRLTMVPASIGELSKLKVLVLGRCQWLQEIPKIPPSLAELDVHQCLRIPPLHKTIFDRIQASPRSEFCTLIPEDTIPQWFEHQELGSSIRVPVPSEDWYNREEFVGFCVCFIFAWQKLPEIDDEIICRLNNFSFFYPYWDKWSYYGPSVPHMWLAYQPRSQVDICHPELWTHISASFELTGAFTDHLPPWLWRNYGIKCGVQLIHASDQ